MRITFVLPTVSLKGGIRVVADYATWLAKKGHAVHVVWPPPTGPSFRERLRGLLGPQRRLIHKRRKVDLSFFGTEGGGCHLKQTPRTSVRPQDVPDADVVVGTWWTAVESISRFPPEKGVKVHFVQGEDIKTPMPPPYAARALAAWRAPMHRIVVSHWLVERVHEICGNREVPIVLNGVDTNFFTADARDKNSTPTVGFVYCAPPIKGCDIIVAALEEAKKKLPDLRVLSFGDSEVSPNCPIPPWIEFKKAPPQHVIREIYGACDAWLWGSREEGFGLPILEAMACRTPVIATPAGAAESLLASGGGELVPHNNPPAMAAATLRICGLSPKDWRTLSDQAYATGRSRSLESAAADFESALLAAVNNGYGRS